MQLQPGDSLGPYELVSPLGKGGMGEVYRVRDTRLERDVAIKVLPDDANDPERTVRFEREAKSLAALNHPNVATIHGFESDGDTHFLVMELVQGNDLADRIARGPIPPDEAIALFKQIADGLAAAHEQGILHRDLKPANIMVGPKGQVKILDFGLAKAMEPEPADVDLSRSPTMTAAATRRGEIMGTAGYMAPEQASGRPLDERSDIWAFGVCLYETLSGRPAFEGTSVSETLASVLRDEPDLAALPADLPGALRRLLRRCLSKDPDHRLHDINDARLELEEALTDADEAKVPKAARPPASRVLVVTAAAALVGLALGALLFRNRDSGDNPRSPVRFVASAPPALRPVLVESVYTPDITVTPDGRTVIWSGFVDGYRRLYAWDTTQLEGRVLTAEAHATVPFVSPDGAWVGYYDWTDSALKKVALSGGQPITLVETESIPLWASWGDSGSLVLTLNGAPGVFELSENGGDLRLLDDSYSGAPVFLPNGRVLLTRDEDEDRALAVLDMDSGEVRELGLPGAAIYSMSGHLVWLAYPGGGVFAAPFDVERLELLADPAPVLEGVQTKLRVANLAISSGGTLAYVAADDPSAPALVPRRRLVWVDRSGQRQPIPAPPRPYRHPQLDPSGRRVALEIFDEDRDIWIWDFERSDLERIVARNLPASFSPVWSLDGLELFSGIENAIWRHSADGSGEAELLFQSTAQVYPLSLSQDGRSLLHRSQTDSADLHVLDLETLDSRPLLTSPGHEYAGEISPDGQWLLYQSDESGQTEVFVRRFPESENWRRKISVDGGHHALWGPDGREIFYRTEEGVVMRVSVDTGNGFQPSVPERLFADDFFSLGGLFGNQWDIAPDGQRFLMIENESEDEAPRPRIVVVQNWFDELERLAPTPR